MQVLLERKNGRLIGVEVDVWATRYSPFHSAVARRSGVPGQVPFHGQVLFHTKHNNDTKQVILPSALSHKGTELR